MFYQFRQAIFDYSDLILRLKAFCFVCFQFIVNAIYIRQNWASNATAKITLNFFKNYLSKFIENFLNSFVDKEVIKKGIPIVNLSVPGSST